LIVRKAGGRWLPVRIDDFDGWLTGLLEASAGRLDATLAAEGRVLRRYCAGSPVMFQGERAWLRVSPFLENEMYRTAWLGTAEAAAIGLATPALLTRIEWCAPHPVPIPVSAEVLTLVTDPVASPDRFLREAPEFSAAWFGDLRRSLTVLAAWQTDRRFRVHDAEQYERLLHATYPRPVPDGTSLEFGTEHLDLVWGNITVPGFQIIDMEHWGLAVKGFGAAYLYLTAMGVPAVAARVHEALSDVLDCRSGRYAQLVAAALILRDLTRLPDPGDLAARLHRHAHSLLT
jgi:hypothetical protein